VYINGDLSAPICFLFLTLNSNNNNNNNQATTNNTTNQSPLKSASATYFITETMVKTSFLSLPCSRVRAAN
jgi:hypothetical protein